MVSGAEDVGALTYTIVANTAFTLKTYLMRSYTAWDLPRHQQMFNYCFFRAKNVLENTFGILTSRWRILLHALNLHPERVNALILTTCILHNFLLDPRENQQWLDDLKATPANLRDLKNMQDNCGLMMHMQ